MGRRPGYQQDNVLTAAAALFRARGFGAVSVEDLVEVTKLNRFALYEKFGGKEGLFYAAMEYYHRVNIKAQLLGPLFRDDATLDSLLAMLRVLKGINADTELPRGCLIVNANIELGGRDERIAAEADYVMASFRGAIAHVLERADARGELAPARSVADGISYLTVMIQAFFSLAYISREAADQLIERVIQEVQTWYATPHPTFAAPVSVRPGAGVFQNARAGLRG